MVVIVVIGRDSSIIKRPRNSNSKNIGLLPGKIFEEGIIEVSKKPKKKIYPFFASLFIYLDLRLYPSLFTWGVYLTRPKVPFFIFFVWSCREGPGCSLFLSSLEVETGGGDKW